MKNQSMIVDPVVTQLKEECPVSAAVAHFNLSILAEQLRSGAEWHSKRRNSVTVFKSGDLHIMLVAMHAVTRMPGHNVKVPLTIQVLEGRIKVVTQKQTLVLERGGLIVLEGGVGYDIEASKESLFLITFAVGGAASTAEA